MVFATLDTAETTDPIMDLIPFTIPEMISLPHPKTEANMLQDAHTLTSCRTFASVSNHIDLFPGVYQADSLPFILQTGALRPHINLQCFQNEKCFQNEIIYVFSFVLFSEKIISVD